MGEHEQSHLVKHARALARRCPPVPMLDGKVGQSACARALLASLVMSSYQIEASHRNYFGDLFRKSDDMFPNLNNSEKKAVGFIITREDNGYEPFEYIEAALDNGDETTQKWGKYFLDHKEQIFIMPRAKRHIIGKSFDFEDKYKILDFIKNDHFINRNPELHLSFDVKKALTLLQIDNE